VAGSQGTEPGLAADAGFAERLLELIDSGRRTATYKLALLMALVDLCARRADAAGSPPSVLYTREIAERIAAIYWPQVIDYRRGPDVVQLRQITLPRSAITEAVLEFRRAAEAAGATSLTLARQRLAREYSQMLDRVEVAVAEQPLPRLQIVGSGEQNLHRHLFGRDRLTPPKALRDGLADLQASRCFYCRKPFRRAPDADHFIPRVRCGIDAVENLVLADSACNNDKRDLLPASPLVDAWAGRNLEHEATLAQLAGSSGWETDAAGTLAVARSIYHHLPPGQVAFWLGTGRVDITHVRPGIVIDIA